MGLPVGAYIAARNSNINNEILDGLSVILPIVYCNALSVIPNYTLNPHVYQDESNSTLLTYR